MDIKLRLALFDATVSASMTYGMETCPLTGRQLEQIDVTQRKNDEENGLIDALFGRVLGRKWQTYEVTTGHCTYSISSTQVVADHPQQQGETSETTVR